MDGRIQQVSKHTRQQEMCHTRRRSMLSPLCYLLIHQNRCQTQILGGCADPIFLQRVVTKECAVGQGWRAYDRLDSIPFEAYLHDSLPRDDHIIEYLGVSIIRRLRTYRLYTAYAELGDLQQLFKNHQDALSHRDHNGERIEAHIPIIALLYIFEAMAASVCLMAHGLLPDDQGNWPESHGDGDAPLGHWGHNIIHSDIKPANYFLSRSANSTVWPELPVAALGDFGNGLDLDEPQYKNDINLARRMGTVRWQSPEQVSNHATEHAVTSATNVYQVGLCIMSLMTLSNPTHDVSYEGNQGSPFPPGVPGFYPSMIIELVNECLQMNSADRPSPKRLYMDVRNLAMEYPERGTHGIPWREYCTPLFARTISLTFLLQNSKEYLPNNLSARSSIRMKTGWRGDGCGNLCLRNIVIGGLEIDNSR